METIDTNSVEKAEPIVKAEGLSGQLTNSKSIKGLPSCHMSESITNVSVPRKHNGEIQLWLILRI